MIEIVTISVIVFKAKTILKPVFIFIHKTCVQ